MSVLDEAGAWTIRELPWFDSAALGGTHENYRDRDAALRRRLAKLQLRQAVNRRRDHRLERVRRGIWLARCGCRDRATLQPSYRHVRACARAGLRGTRLRNAAILWWGHRPGFGGDR